MNNIPIDPPTANMLTFDNNMDMLAFDPPQALNSPENLLAITLNSPENPLPLAAPQSNNPFSLNLHLTFHPLKILFILNLYNPLI